jgi:molybdopterin converting factor small subunit
MLESPAVLIRIPTPLRNYTGGADVVAVNGENVADALAALGQRHPGILERVLGDDGELRQFVNVYLGSANIRTLEGLGTPLETDDILAIIPAVAGGGR